MLFLIGWIVFAYVLAYAMYALIQIGPAVLYFFFSSLCVAADFLIDNTIRAVRYTAPRLWRGSVLLARFAVLFIRELSAPDSDEDEEEENPGPEPDAPAFDAYERALARLGVSPACGRTSVTQAYRALMKRVHPDAPGGSTQAAQEVNEAYALIKQRRGWA